MLLLALACSSAPEPITVSGPGYSITVPAAAEEVLRSGLRLELAERDRSPTIRIDEPSQLPQSAEALLEDALRVERPDPLTVLAAGSTRGRAVVAVLKAATEDGPFIQATCTGLPEEADLLEATCSSLQLMPPAPAARHPLTETPLTLQAPHPPQPDGPLRWRIAPPDHELAAIEVSCRQLDRAPSTESLAAMVSPHGDPAVIAIPGGLAALIEDAGGLTDAVAELAVETGSWQCQCSSIDHIWRQGQALEVCLSLQVP